MYHSSAYIVSTIFGSPRYLWVLLAVLPLSVLYANLDQLTGVIPLVEEYRVDRNYAAEVEHERESSILELFCSNLIHYSSIDSLEDAVKYFIWETLGSDDFILIDASQTNMKGRSQNRIFFVNDCCHHFNFVVKAFPDPCLHPSEYLAEISALSMIEKFAFPHIAPVKPLNCAIYRSRNQNWGLLLETAAQGKRLDTYLYPLVEASLNLEEQKYLEAEAKRAFSRMGQSLAQLHGCGEVAFGPMPEWNLERYDHRVKEILGNEFICRELSHTISVSAFVNYITFIKNETLALSVPFTYLHGDAHFGNMFYFEEEDLFYFIDVARLHKSVDRRGVPILDGTLDLLRVEENLKIFVIEGLPENIADSLLKTFYQSYSLQSGRIPDTRLLDFYRTFMVMGRLTINSRYNSENESHQKKNLFESALKELEVLLKRPANLVSNCINNYAKNPRESSRG